MTLADDTAAREAGGQMAVAVALDKAGELGVYGS